MKKPAITIEPIAYCVSGCDDPFIRIEACGQSEWIVVSGDGCCLGVSGEWNDDPGCRFRTPNWYQEHQFSTIEEAVDAIDFYQKRLDRAVF
ncbi:hypothetical protein HUU62_08740 [Rhodoferax sp. 4810]|uniref:Uncharacterized protein n=1 Tax=Thiospirillum jenense TaxID=1653858 RepID=A0A839HBD7_9GAMM|nr:hypothetical protein [Thiospirillum jenense]MBB1074496.1 hypothetical protein [Rhodoferax jenense]MBB1125520.1 hypothetical protein [Thiospirillum jenense]